MPEARSKDPAPGNPASDTVPGKMLVRKMRPDDLPGALQILRHWNMAPVAPSSEVPDPERTSIEIDNAFVAEAASSAPAATSSSAMAGQKQPAWPCIRNHASRVSACCCSRPDSMKCGVVVSVGCVQKPTARQPFAGMYGASATGSWVPIRRSMSSAGPMWTTGQCSISTWPTNLPAVPDVSLRWRRG